MLLPEIYYEILAALVYIQGLAACGLTIFVWRKDRWPKPKEFVLVECMAAIIVFGLYAIEFIVILMHYYGM